MNDKWERSALGKIWTVIQTIKHRMTLTGSNEIKVRLNDFGLSSVDIVDIFIRLQYTDKIITILQPNALERALEKTGYSLNYLFKIKVIEKNFEKVASKIEKDYKAMAGDYQSKNVETKLQEKKGAKEVEEKEEKPKPQYRKGRLIYGKIAEYSPNKQKYQDILNFLWPRKQIRNEKGEVLPRKSGNPYSIKSLANEIIVKKNDEEWAIGEEKLRKSLSHLDKEISAKMPIEISQRGSKALMIIKER